MSSRYERKVGEKFYCMGYGMLVCVKQDNCRGCVFGRYDALGTTFRGCYKDFSTAGYCDAFFRTDNCDVVFKMEDDV